MHYRQTHQRIQEKMHGWHTRRGNMAINVNVETNPDGFMTIQVEGHAESTICAAVSTLLQSQVRFLQELSQAYPDEIKIKVNGGTQ